MFSVLTLIQYCAAGLAASAVLEKANSRLEARTVRRAKERMIFFLDDCAGSMASGFQTSIFPRGFAPHPDLALTRKMLAKNLAAIHPLAAVA